MTNRCCRDRLLVSCVRGRHSALWHQHFPTSGRKGPSFMWGTIRAAYGSRCGACPRMAGSLPAAINFRPGRTASAGMNHITTTERARRLRSWFSTPCPIACMLAGSMLRSIAMRIMAPSALPIPLPVCTLLCRWYSSPENDIKRHRCDRTCMIILLQCTSLFMARTRPIKLH
jgi:hypothetical protein